LNAPHQVCIVLGTRPEAIKLAPVIQAFQAAEGFHTRLVLTGQHREMVQQVMELFALKADRDLALMAPKQTLTHVTCAALQGLGQEFADRGCPQADLGIHAQGEA
jgi:UDP-N-acetylglucosamine 2-epimerase (non-hydrolysing)